MISNEQSLISQFAENLSNIGKLIRQLDKRPRADRQVNGGIEREYVHIAQNNDKSDLDFLVNRGGHGAEQWLEL